MLRASPNEGMIGESFSDAPPLVTTRTCFSSVDSNRSQKLAGLGLSPADAGPSPRPSAPWQMMQFWVNVAIPAEGFPFSSPIATTEEKQKTAARIRRESEWVMPTAISNKAASQLTRRIQDSGEEALELDQCITERTLRTASRFCQGVEGIDLPHEVGDGVRW